MKIRKSDLEYIEFTLDGLDDFLFELVETSFTGVLEFSEENTKLATQLSRVWNCIEIFMNMKEEEKC